MSARADVAERPPAVTITVDGQALSAYPGESLAAALLATGRYTLRASPRAKEPRGAFCLMGVCQECLVLLDGRRILACQASVAAGMVVETGHVFAA